MMPVNVLDSVEDIEKNLPWITAYFLLFSIIILAILNSTTYLYRLFVSFSNPHGYAAVGDYVAYLSKNVHILYAPYQNEPHISTVYTPLYMIITNIVYNVLNESVNIFYIGRLISVLSIFGIIVLMKKISNEIHSSYYIGPVLIAATLFILSPVVKNASATVRVDPLGAFIGILAVYWYLSKESKNQLIGSFLFSFLAISTKQSFIVVPISITLALLLERRIKESSIFIAGLLITAIGTYGAVEIFTQLQIFEQLFIHNSLAPFYPTSIFSRTFQFVQKHALLVSLFIVSTVYYYEELPDILLIYTLVSLSLAFVTLGKSGANVKYYLPALPIIVIIGIYILHDNYFTLKNNLTAKKRPSKTILLVLVLIVFQLGLYMMPLMLYQPSNGAGEVTDYIADSDGPILTDRASLIINTDRSLRYDPVTMSFITHSGYWNAPQLLEDICEQEYEYIITYSYNISSENAGGWQEYKYFTEEQLEHMDEAYRFDEKFGYFYVFEPDEDMQTTCSVNDDE